MNRYEQLVELIGASAPDVCTIWPHGKTTGGYGIVTMNGHRGYAHRIACAHQYGEAPSGTEAAHSCGVRACVNPHHLRWATRSENQLDRRQHGTARVGATNNLTKLTADQVVEIRRQLSSGATRRDVATEFGVTESNLSHIAAGKTWGWLECA